MKLSGILLVVVIAISAAAALNQSRAVNPAQATTIIPTHDFPSIVGGLTYDDCLQGLERGLKSERSLRRTQGIVHFQCHSKVYVEEAMNEKAVLEIVEQNIRRVFSEYGVELRKDRGSARRSFFRREKSHGFISWFVGTIDTESSVYVTVVATEAGRY